MPFTSRQRALSYFGVATAFTLSINAAFAADVTITDDRTTAVNTTTLLGTSGTLTVSADGSITTGSGAAITLDGNHSLDIQGALTSNDTTNGRLIAVDTSDLTLTGTININGALEIPGPTDADTASNNIGFGIFGTGAFQGDITIDEDATLQVSGGGSKGLYIGTTFVGDLTNEGAIAVEGEGSIGVDIAADMTGDLTLDGSISANNKDSIGVRITGAIDGAYSQAGTISFGSARTTDSDGDVVDAVPGIAGIQINNDITGGLMIAGKGEDYDGEETTVPTGAIVSYGGAPAILIENTKSDNSDLTLGAADTLGYGLVHRGSINVQGQSSGLTATGISILGGDGNAWTRLADGIHIDDGTMAVSAVDATAKGIVIGDNADVPELFNRGNVQITSTVTVVTADDTTTDADETVYSAGGDVTTVEIAEGGVMTGIVNEGTLYASAAGDGQDAYVVRDLSGNLTSITNSGIWFAARGTDNEDGLTVALDVTANTTGVTVVNEGRIFGDLLLGSGGDSVSLGEESIMEGNIDFGAGANSFLIEGDASFTGTISHAGSLDLTLAGGEFTVASDGVTNVTTASLLDGGTLSIAVDTVEQAAGQLVASGNITIEDGAAITPVFSTIVTGEQSYEIIRAGSLTLDGGTLDTTLANRSYLIAASLHAEETDDAVTLTVRPKTNAELGFTGNRATLYDNLLEALDPEDTLGTALTTVSDADEATAAIDALLPDLSNSGFQLAYTGARQLQASIQDRVTDVTARRRLAGGFWAREMLGSGKTKTSTEYDRLKYTGAGVLIGYDGAVSDTFLWGVSTGFMLQGAERKGARGDDVSIFSPFIGTYAVLSNHGLFASTSASFWYNDADRTRNLDIGAFSKVIESAATGWNVAADVDVGYDLRLGGLHLKPQIGIAYLKGHEGGYTETGGDGANLVVDGRSYNRVDGTGRVSLGYDIRWKKATRTDDFGTIVRPEIYVAARKKLSGSDAGVTSVRFENSDTLFDLNTNAVADKGYEGGALLNIFHAYGTASLRYTYEKQGDWRNHYAGFNFQLEF